MRVVIVEGEGAVFGANLGRPTNCNQWGHSFRSCARATNSSQFILGKTCYHYYSVTIYIARSNRNSIKRTYCSLCSWKRYQTTLPVYVVVELVVASKCKQNSKAGSKREENLRSCVDPYLLQISRH